MQLIAVIKSKTQMENGKSSNGNPWKRITLVVESIGDHPKEAAVVFLNQMADIASREIIGNVVKIGLDAESRLYEGRYYTELRGYSIRPAYQAPANSINPHDPTPQPAPDFDPNDQNLDDLPY